MSISGLIEKLNRETKKFLKRNIIRPLMGIRKKPEEKEETVVPSSWLRGPGRSKIPERAQLTMRKGKVVATAKPVYHWPWLRNIKRLLAAVLLLINFIFTQFLLVSTGGIQISALFFFGNCFILIDYLWRTRRAPVLDA
jgi:hypothetical protein